MTSTPELLARRSSSNNVCACNAGGIATTTIPTCSISFKNPKSSPGMYATSRISQPVSKSSVTMDSARSRVRSISINARRAPSVSTPRSTFKDRIIRLSSSLGRSKIARRRTRSRGSLAGAPTRRLYSTGCGPMDEYGVAVEACECMSSRAISRSFVSLMCFSTAVREVIARSSIRGPRGSSFCAFGANASPSVATAADSTAVRFILGTTAFFMPCGDARARAKLRTRACVDARTTLC